LPLAKETKIALVGPLASSPDILGGWNVYGEEKDGINVETGLREVFETVEVISTEYTEFSDEDKVAVKAAVQNMDVVVLALGEKNEWGGE
ncbi:glycoside hydrolase family 3 C-terminal domain-containing protein, partial [Listeria monocytogenes]|nr:glycoside hydrolase family 3 C-terminal domain-containing protein [Listeria monocytogenes]